jgi:glutamate--cysteine ligase
MFHERNLMPNILQTLTELYNTRGEEVENWLAEQRAVAAPYFYSSVDLRHSGLRIAPVDTNLFPAGFQNLSPAARVRATRQITSYMAEHFPNAIYLFSLKITHEICHILIIYMFWKHCVKTLVLR